MGERRRRIRVGSIACTSLPVSTWWNWKSFSVRFWDWDSGPSFLDRVSAAENATYFDALAKLTGVRGSDILFVSDYIAKEH